MCKIKFWTTFWIIIWLSESHKKSYGQKSEFFIKWPSPLKEISREPIMYNLIFIADSKSPQSLLQNDVCIYQYFHYDQIPDVLKLTKFL